MSVSTYPKKTGIFDGVTIEISDTTVSDHGDATQAGSIAEAIARINAITTDADRRGRIVIGPGEFTCSTRIKIYDNIDLVGSGRGVTVLNFTDANGGILASSSEVWQANTAYSVGDYVVPDTTGFGTPGWAAEVRYRCTVAGTSHATTQPVAWGTGATAALTPATVSDNGITWTRVTNPKVYVGNFSFDMDSSMTGDGISFRKMNRLFCSDLSCTGGNGTALNNAIGFHTVNIFGASKLDLETAGNGIFVGGDDWAQYPYNFGDGAFSQVSMSLTGTGGAGFVVKGSPTTAKVMNNMLVSQMSVTGTGAVADCNTGIWLDNASRCSFQGIDVERCNVGVMDISRAAAGANQSNSFDMFHFIPDAAQNTEAYRWARGIPFQTAYVGSNEVIVREAWLDLDPYTDMASKTTLYFADDDGIYSRNVAAVGSPAAGLVTLTMSGAIPASGQTNLNRHPVLLPENALSTATSFRWGSSEDGNVVLPGDLLAFGIESTLSYVTAYLKLTAKGTINLRELPDTAGNVTLDSEGYVLLTPLSSAPGSPAAGMFAVDDGTDWSGVAVGATNTLVFYNGAAWKACHA